jgi:hypothetical protein
MPSPVARFVKSVLPVPKAEVGEAQQELDALEVRITRMETRATALAAQAQAFEREAATLRAVGDEAGRIQQAMASEKSPLATCKVEGIPADTRHLVDLRSQLTAALGRKEEADTDAGIADDAAADRRKAFAALQPDIRILQQQRPERVRQVILERLAAAAPAFEALRKQMVEQYVSIFSVSLAHDRLAEALKAGTFVGGLRSSNLRLPIPEGFPEILDLEALYRDVEGGAIALLRDLKVHS